MKSSALKCAPCQKEQRDAFAARIAEMAASEDIGDVLDAEEDAEVQAAAAQE